MLDATFFRRVGPNVRDRYREHIFGKAKDVYDKPFKDYTSKLYAERKRANKFKRQAASYANTTAPVLTSDLLRDFSLVRVSPNGFQLGWTTYGARVQSLANKKRFLSTKQQPLPKGVINYMMKQAEPYTDKKLKKIIPKSKTIRIGKK